MNNMEIKEIVDIHGMTTDYYDVENNVLYCLTRAFYCRCKNQTVIPMIKDSMIIGTARMEGNYCVKYK